ncbi:hypothetical protein DM02DRAFT_119782 [Periconia macrospinosa]|uniref:Uncharacterized protein n=1 Tax=Periconia macrospinosa TaxID=97972 RepID=A0A2V1DFR1_9PLEO|nr:hypothetical protein DM02DRAFT_119782 [Periconia macrospinosa]
MRPCSHAAMQPCSRAVQPTAATDSRLGIRRTRLASNQRSWSSLDASTCSKITIHLPWCYRLRCMVVLQPVD